MKTYIRIRSEYFTEDASKYRLAISNLTIIPSLANQDDKDFTIVLERCPMDPKWTMRWNSFRSCGVPVIDVNDWGSETPSLEITVGDDDFLFTGFVRFMKSKSTYAQNTHLVAPNGFLWMDGKLYPWIDEATVDAIQWYTDDEFINGREVISTSPAWIQCRHQMNSRILEAPAVDPAKSLNPPGWKPRLLERLCSLKLAQASALGCELHPMRSKSVVFAHGSFRKRRIGR